MDEPSAIQKERHCSNVVIRYTEGWLLWRLTGNNDPEVKGKWTVPGAEGRPGESPRDTAIRAFREDVGMEPDEKKLHLMLENAVTFNDTGEEGKIYYYKYEFRSEAETELLPKFEPNEITDQREWVHAATTNPDFVNRFLECAAHYIQMTWRYRKPSRRW